MHKHLFAGNAVSPAMAIDIGLAAEIRDATVTEPYETVAFAETTTNVDRRDKKKPCEDPIDPDRSAIDKFIAALIRIRGMNRLDDAVISRHWLATDMRVTFETLDRLLKQLCRQGLIGLPNDHLVTILDESALKEVALYSN